MLTDSEPRLRHNRRWLRRTILSALVIMLSLVTILAGWAYYHRDEFTVGLHPGPEKLLAEVIASSGLPVGQADQVEVIDLDGNMPASARRKLKLSVSAQESKFKIIQACRSLGLVSPDVLARSAEPDLVCNGTWNEWNASVYFSASCSGACDAIITAAVI